MLMLIFGLTCATCMTRCSKSCMWSVWLHFEIPKVYFPEIDLHQSWTLFPSMATLICLVYMPPSALRLTTWCLKSCIIWSIWPDSRILTYTFHEIIYTSNTCSNYLLTFPAWLPWYAWYAYLLLQHSVLPHGAWSHVGPYNLEYLARF